MTLTTAAGNLDKSNDEWSFITCRHHIADIIGVLRDGCHVNVAMSAQEMANLSSIGIFTFDPGLFWRSSSVMHGALITELSNNSK